MFRYLTTLLLLAPLLSAGQQDTVVTADFESLASNRTGKSNVHIIVVDTNTEHVLAEGAFMDEKKNGAWLIYTPEGGIKRMETYSMGVLDGMRFVRYDNGEYERKERYANGELAEGHCYTGTGTELPYYKEPYSYVEIMPRPGYDFDRYIAKALEYPAGAKERKKEGTVVVKFIIGEDGHIFNAWVAKGFDRECDAEALRLVQQMKAWKPGRQDGEAVNTWVTKVIPFRL